MPGETTTTTAPAGQQPAGDGAQTQQPPAGQQPPNPERLQFLREKQALEQQKTALKADLARADEWKKATASKRPVEILKAAGLDAKTIAALFLTGGVEQPAKPEDKIAELKNELTEELKKVRDETTKLTTTAAQRETQEARAAAFEAMAENKEALPFVHAMGQQDAVIEEMVRHHKETGETLELDAAAKAVEGRIAAGMPSVVEQLLASPSVRKMLEEALAKKPGEKAPATTTDTTVGGLKVPKPPAAKAPVTTLSNALAQDGGGGSSTPKKPGELWKELRNRTG